MLMLPGLRFQGGYKHDKSPAVFSFLFLFLFCFGLVFFSLLSAFLKYDGNTKRGRDLTRVNKQGGRKRLPKFKFSAKFPIGLHVILQIQIKKFESDCYIM